MATIEDDILKHISYVTLRDVWHYIKNRLIVWIAGTVIFAVIGVLIHFGVSATETENISSSIPKPIWFIVLYAVFTWMVRGKKIQWTFPHSFIVWLLSVIFLSVIVLVVELLPAWTIMPVYFGLVLGVYAIGELADIGKANFEKLERSTHDSIVDELEDA